MAKVALSILAADFAMSGADSITIHQEATPLRFVHAGADILVAGSAVFGSDNPHKAVSGLRGKT